MKYRKGYSNVPDLLQISDTVIINSDCIDAIEKTFYDNDTGSRLKEPRYIIFLKNSRYSKVNMTQGNFDKYLKPYIKNIY